MPICAADLDPLAPAISGRNEITVQYKDWLTPTVTSWLKIPGNNSVSAVWEKEVIIIDLDIG